MLFDGQYRVVHFVAVVYLSAILGKILVRVLQWVVIFKEQYISFSCEEFIILFKFAFLPFPLFLLSVSSIYGYVNG